jgi:hypothetical protein
MSDDAKKTPHQISITIIFHKTDLFFLIENFKIDSLKLLRSRSEQKRRREIGRSKSGGGAREHRAQ